MTEQQLKKYYFVNKAGEYKQIAVKIIDGRGTESSRIPEL